MDSEKIISLLMECEKSRQPMEPLTDQFPELSVAEAYELQSLWAQKALSLGRKRVGYKVGLTSEEAQKFFGVFEPDFGWLFSDMEVPNAGEVPLNELIQPKIEGEVAFRMGRDVQGAEVTADEVIDCIDGICVSMEVVDSRIRDWKIKAADTIADNGSSSRFILSGNWIPLKEVDLTTAGMALSENGDVLVTATGAAVMNNPVNAVVFLVKELAKRQQGLVQGDVLLSGSLGGMIPMKPGAQYCCEMLGLGKVTCRGGDNGAS